MEKAGGEVQNQKNVPHAVGTIDVKHIVMKKPKKSGSDYYNYKGFFFLVLLALVDAEHRFLWIDCVSSGSCSDAQIFNGGDSREKIKDDSLGLLAPEPLEREGQTCTTSCRVTAPLP